MTKPSDFRRSRRNLPDSAFLWVGIKQKPPLEWRVDKETWEGIVHLPDDVSLRTSDWFGEELRIAYQTATQWWDMFGDVPEGESDFAPLREFIISNYAEGEASIFNALVGYYRQAGASLRFVLEAMLSGIYFSTTPERHIAFDRHRQGDKAVPIPYLREIRKDLYQAESFKAFNTWLTNNSKPEFLATRSSGCITALYDELTEFSHGRMASESTNGAVAAYSNVDMWESNGPILRRDQFLRWFDLFCATLFCCGALIRVYLLKPAAQTEDYLSAYRTTMSIYMTEGARTRVALLADYLRDVVGE